MPWTIKIIIIADNKRCPYRQELVDEPENWFECCHPHRSDEHPCECLEEFCPLKLYGD